MTSKKYFTKLLPVILILVLMTACSEEKKDKIKSDSVQTKAVSKKIEMPPSEIKKEFNTEVKEKINNEAGKIISPENISQSQASNELSVKPAEPKSSSQANPEINLKSEVSVDPSTKTSVDKPLLPATIQGTDNKTDVDDKEKEYNPAGKINPFISFISEEQDKEKSEDVDSRLKKREPLTPLEKIDIAQLKLTAITRTATGNLALVEEPGGKGYVVTEGTYVGLNSGKVINVLSDKIIIEEETENIFGKVSIQERELKLQKPTGE